MVNTGRERVARFLRAFFLAGCALASAATNLTVAPVSLSFTYQSGNALPPAQTLQVTSPGAVLSVTPTVTGPLPYMGQWLTLSGHISDPTPAGYKVYVNPNQLPSGVYTATITLTSAGAANSPVTIPVTLTVGAAPPALTVTPASLTFNYTTGTAAPSPQSVVLFSNGLPLNATLSVGSTAWLSAAPSGDIVLVGLPSTVTVSVNPTNMIPGTYAGKLTFTSTAAANKTVVVPVTLNIVAETPATAGVYPPGALVNSPQSVVTITGTGFFGNTITAVNGITVPSVVLSYTAIQATIPASFLANAGSLLLTVTTPAPGGGTSNATSFSVFPPGPQILAIANTASYNTSGISPGGIVTIYGVGIGPPALIVFTPSGGVVSTSLPASAPNTQVTFNGVAAPLIYASFTAVSAIVPYALAAQIGSSVNVAVTYNGVASTAFPMPVIATDPGVFSLNASGQGQAAALNFNAATGDYTVNSAANAAPAGSTVVFYITGAGQTTPAGVEGQLISGSVTPVAAITVQIGGQAAAVQAAVAPPGSVAGLFQINVTVPTGLPPNAAAPVVIAAGTANSQSGVTIATR